MAPYVANSTLVDTPHLETFFHTGKQTLYFRPKRMNQFEVIAELGIVPIYLREHLPFRTVDPANPNLIAGEISGVLCTTSALQFVSQNHM